MQKHWLSLEHIKRMLNIPNLWKYFKSCKKINTSILKGFLYPPWRNDGFKNLNQFHHSYFYVSRWQGTTKIRVMQKHWLSLEHIKRMLNNPNLWKYFKSCKKINTSILKGFLYPPWRNDGFKNLNQFHHSYFYVSRWQGTTKIRVMQKHWLSLEHIKRMLNNPNLWKYFKSCKKINTSILKGFLYPPWRNDGFKNLSRWMYTL